MCRISSTTVAVNTILNPFNGHTLEKTLSNDMSISLPADIKGDMSLSNNESIIWMYFDLKFPKNVSYMYENGDSSYNLLASTS